MVPHFLAPLFPPFLAAGLLAGLLAAGFFFEAAFLAAGFLTPLAAFFAGALALDDFLAVALAINKKK